MALGSFLGRFIRDRSAAHAVESAFVLPILFMMILGGLQFGLTLFCQAQLDNATYVASRQIMIGALQTAGGNQSNFTSTLCGQLQLMSCSAVQVDVQSGASFLSLTPSGADASGQMSSTGFSPGGPQSDVLVQVAYEETCFVPLVCNLFSSNGKIFLLSNLSFENENY